MSHVITHLACHMCVCTYVCARVLGRPKKQSSNVLKLFHKEQSAPEVSQKSRVGVAVVRMVGVVGAGGGIVWYK